MQMREWTFLARADWKPGEWDSEPDKKQWQDAATSFPCLALRNHHGVWCGYVGVSASHPAFEKTYQDVDVDVHGGLTFSDKCTLEEKEHGICHIIEDGEDANVWWLGFDCHHGGDYAPVFSAVYDLPGEVYRTLSYVEGECASLAKQLQTFK